MKSHSDLGRGNACMSHSRVILAAHHMCKVALGNKEEMQSWKGDLIKKLFSSL